jgi:hypothetical protein
MILLLLQPGSMITNGKLKRKLSWLLSRPSLDIDEKSTNILGTLGVSNKSSCIHVRRVNGLPTGSARVK